MTGYFNISTYTNSIDLFDALWSEWVKEQLISLALNTPLIDLDYEEIFTSLPEKEKRKICDAGKYGYAMLTYYKPPIGFDGIVMFTDSQKMYNTLLREWYTLRIEELAKTMNMSNFDVDVFYEQLSDEQKVPLIQQRQEFIEMSKKIAYFIK